MLKAHDDLYGLKRISDQQDKANLLSTETSVFQLVPRTKILRTNNEAPVYLAKQLFGKSQREYIYKYCPNFARNTNSYCGARLDSRDLHLRTCKMNNVNHEKHEALKHWFQDLTKQDPDSTGTVHIGSIKTKPHEAACGRSRAD